MTTMKFRCVPSAPRNAVRLREYPLTGLEVFETGPLLMVGMPLQLTPSIMRVAVELVHTEAQPLSLDASCKLRTLACCRVESTSDIISNQDIIPKARKKPVDMGEGVLCTEVEVSDDVDT